MLCAWSAAASGQNAAVRGWCETGNTPVITSGLTSLTLTQVSFPQCTVTVFLHGGGLATIFSDATGTPLNNPFTASLNGQYIFYGTTAQHVDVQLSGGLPVPGFPTPVTLSDIIIGGGSGGGGSSGYTTIDVSGSPFAQRAILNFIPGTNVALTCADNSGNGSTDCTISVPTLGVTGLQVNGVGTQAGIINLIAGANMTITPGVGSITFTSTGGGGGGSAPGAPTNSLQQNNGGGGFSGVDLLYTPGIAGPTACFGPSPTLCNVYRSTSSVGDALFFTPASDLTPTRGNLNQVIFQATPATTDGSTIALFSAFKTTTGQTITGLQSRTAIIGTGVAQGLQSIATDDFSDAASGQTLQAGVFGVGLSKLAGSVAAGIGVDILPVQSWANNGVGVCCNAITESVTNMYGIRIGDQGVGNHSTSEQAAIKILPQSLGIANAYSIKVDAGGGVARFGSGVADDTLTAGQCLQAATVGGFTRLQSTGTACGSSAPGGINQNVQFNDSGVFNGATTFLYDKVNGELFLSIPPFSTDLDPFNIQWSTNNAAVVFHGLIYHVNNIAQSAGTLNYQFCGGAGGTLCFTIDTAGNVAAAGSIATGNTGAAGNISFPQGPLPGTITNSAQFTAPTSIPTSYQMVLPSAPCSGYVTWSVSSNIATIPNCGGAPTQYLGSTYTNATTTFSNLLAFTAAANTSYSMACHLVYSGSAATSGPKVQITGPASPTNVFYSFQAATNQTVFSGAAATAFSSSLNIGATVAVATPLPYMLTMGLINGANAGTVQVQAAAQGAGILTISPGSFCMVTP